MRIDGFLGYVDLRYPFFGVGSTAGSAGVSVPIVQKGYAFVPELLYQVAKSTFLGARLRAVRVETALDGSPPAIVEPLTGQSILATSTGVGPVAVYDTRDNEMNAASGVLIDFRQLRRAEPRQRPGLSDVHPGGELLPPRRARGVGPARLRLPRFG